MLIECKLKRKGGTKIEFANEDGDVTHNYHFVPRADLPAVPHLAEITEPAHIERLLTLPEAYREFTGQAPTKRAATITKPAAAPAAEPEPETAIANSPVVASIRALSVRELKATINTFSPDELRAALQAESADGADKPRTSWIEVIKAHLGEA
jgi:hypothetical protein